MAGSWKVPAKRAALRVLPGSLRVKVARSLWNRQNRDSELGYISHLRSGEWDREEFTRVGQRFVDQMIARYDDYATVPKEHATVLEIGCGVGRFLRPLSDVFAQAIGVDFSGEMLKDAARYLDGRTNVTLLQNDGAKLKGVGDESVDFVVSAGVFQHITVLSAIHSYFREAIRVLKPDGIALIQFEGNRTAEIGMGQSGAKVTAAGLDKALSGEPFKIREVSMDSRDHVRNVVVVLKRTTSPTHDRFVDFPSIERPWIVGIYDDIATDVDMRARQAADPQRLTFYD